MKKFKIIFLTAILLIAFSYDGYSQGMKGLVRGSYYTLTLNNGVMIEGKVMALDSGKAVVNTAFGLYEVQLQDVKEVLKLSKSEGTLIVYGETNSKGKNFLSLGAGAIFGSVSEDIYSYGVGVGPGFNVSVSYGNFTGRATAYRAGFSFSMMPNEYSEANQYYYYTRSGGSNIQFDFEFDYMIGLLKPESEFNPYVFGGLGLGTMNSTSVTNTYSNQYYSSGEEKFDPDAQLFYKITFGAGTFFKLSKKQALQLDIAYDITSVSEFYSDMNQIRVKAAFVFLNF